MLRNCKIGDEALAPLAELVRTSASIQRIQLQQNRITASRELDGFASALHESCSVEVLACHSGDIRDARDDARDARVT